MAASVFHVTASWSTLDSNRGLTVIFGRVLLSQVRHFALHSLERMLKLRWRPVRDVKRKNGSRNGAGNAEAEPAPNPGDPPPLSLAEKEQLKECMIQVMARGTRDVSQEAQFIKIKVTAILFIRIFCRVEIFESFRYIRSTSVIQSIPQRVVSYVAKQPPLSPPGHGFHAICGINLAWLHWYRGSS